MRTPEKDRTNLQYTGIGLMVLSAWSIVQGVMVMMSPWSMTVAMSPLPQDVTVYAIIGIGIALNLVEFYFGYAAYKLKPTDTLAMLSLIFGIILLVGSLLLLASGDGMNFGVPLACGIVAISYYVYAKRIIKQQNQAS